MEILGVIFSSKSSAGELKNNCENIVDTIERTLNVWSKRDPSINLKKKKLLFLKPLHLAR